MGRFGRAALNHPLRVAAEGADDGVDDRETPDWFFQAQHARHCFTVDVAASPTNAKLPRYITIGGDALRLSWDGEVVWCNPPYSDCGAWVRKALHEVRHGCPKVVMLLPANRTELNWWQDLIEPVRDRGIGVRVEFVRARLKFLGVGVEGKKCGNRPAFGVVLVTFTPPPALFQKKRLARYPG